jgi:glycosyltransferase involved in cell wall biosynthesis
MILFLIADGRSIHTQRWAEFFVRSGCEVHLATYDPMGLNIPGVTEHVIESRWSNLYLSFWPRHFQILRLVRKIRPDIIHAHFITKYGFHLPFLGRYPKVVSAWGDDVLVLPQSSRLLFHFTKMVLSGSDLIYAVSEDIRTHIVQDFSIPSEKVKYLPFGVDTETFRPIAKDTPGHDYILFFSNRGFLPIYGMDVILDAFFLAHAENPDIRLILKGEGNDKERLQRIVSNRGAGHLVTFLGKGDYAGVPGELQQMDVFITAATRDGTPVSLLEAMAAGLPCIATSVGGVPEWIVDGKNGILIATGDVKALAEKILSLASDQEERKRLGRAARDTILERGDWATLMQKSMMDYEKLVQ